MTAQIKNFLTISLKNAINALLTSSALMALNLGRVQLHVEVRLVESRQGVRQRHWCA